MCPLLPRTLVAPLTGPIQGRSMWRRSQPRAGRARSTLRRFVAAQDHPYPAFDVSRRRFIPRRRGGTALGDECRTERRQ